MATAGNDRSRLPVARMSSKEVPVDQDVDEDDEDETMKVMMKKMIKVMRNTDKNVSEVKNELKDLSTKVNNATTQADNAIKIAEKTAGNMKALEEKVAGLEIDTSKQKDEVKTLVAEAVQAQC